MKSSYVKRQLAMSRNVYEANWNGQASGQTDGQDHVLSQTDALTKKGVHGIQIYQLVFTVLT